MQTPLSHFLIDEIVTRERLQLISYWRKLFGEKRGKLDLSRAPFTRLLSPERGSRDDVRKFHDAFGWCAKQPVNCAGAIYRSQAFMELNPDQRDASKPRNLAKCDWPRNIHIEHTILSSQLHDMWLTHPVDEPASPVFLLYNGIATAMHVTEERALGGDYRTPNPCYVDGSGLPFLRYMGKLPPTSSIWNVLTGQRICMKTFTLTHHRQNIRTLLKMTAAPVEWINNIPA